MDSVPRIVSSIKALARKVQLDEPSVKSIHDIIGLSLPIAFERLFNVHAEADKANLLNVYRSIFIEEDQTPSPMFDGAIETLTKLKDAGFILAVATGKARRGLNRAWQQTNTAHFFTTSRCASECPSKPHPAMIQDILQQTGINQQHALMVGDSIHDLHMAQNAGVDSIGVTYGVHGAERLQEAQPRHLINEIIQLQELLLN